MRSVMGKLLGGVLTLLALAGPAWADIGPKPSMAFTFTLPDHIQIKSGVLDNCTDLACANPAPLRPLGPQRFGCGAAECSAQAYGFAPYFQLELTLTDGRTVKSPVTKVGAFDSRYHGAIKGEALTLQPAL